jgi:two-component system phosphate regulon response regulator PhoB
VKNENTENKEMTRIIVVEDEADICEVLVYNLKRQGYAVEGCGDGLSGLALIRERQPGLVLLDLMLPGLDGLEICRRLKTDAATAGIPVIMVTARGEESDIVAGLELGADDYVTKPFGTRELVARVKAVLRRRHEGEENTANRRIIRDGLEIDPDRHQVRIDRKPVKLTLTQFRLLHFLAAHPGRVFTRDHLISRIMG